MPRQQTRASMKLLWKYMTAFKKALIKSVQVLSEYGEHRQSAGNGWQDIHGSLRRLPEISCVHLCTAG